MLFRISNTDVFVCGSLHLLPGGEKLPSGLFEAIAAADDCVFESDLENGREPEFARYSDGDTIDQHISPELFAATTALCESLDVPGVLPDLKPWWVTIVLGVRLIMRTGRTFESGADRQLWDATKRAGKTPFVLESSEVLRLIDSAPLSEQIARLQFVVSNPDQAEETFTRLYTAWRRGDTQALARELQKQSDLAPITMGSLVRDRNHQWIPQILGAIQRRRRAAFVVGAMHLAGEHSLQELLGIHGHALLPA